jgi:hypothetical protein
MRSFVTPCPTEPGLEVSVNAALDAALGPLYGKDSEDFEYHSITHLWKVEAQRKARGKPKKELAAASATATATAAATATATATATSSSTQATAGVATGEALEGDPSWYTNALGFWDACEPTVEGMLGGFGVLTVEDVKGSTAFLEKLWAMRPALGRGVVVDCGAGIGRVTKHLLLPLFASVHLLEQSPPLIAQAPAYLGAAGAARTTLLNIGMQVPWGGGKLRVARTALAVVAAAVLKVAVYLAECTDRRFLGACRAATPSCAACRRLTRRRPRTTWCGCSGSSGTSRTPTSSPSSGAASRSRPPRPPRSRPRPRNAKTSSSLRGASELSPGVRR